MKKSRFTESQIVAILKEGEAGLAVAQLTRKHGISAATYYAGAGVGELKRLREARPALARAAKLCRYLGASDDEWPKNSRNSLS
jgi:putative transposase